MSGISPSRHRRDNLPLNGSSRADLWGVGGVILYWDHLAYEHYTAGLEDGRTHLVVNVTFWRFRASETQGEFRHEE